MQFFKNIKIQKIMLAAFVMMSCIYGVLPVNGLTVKAADFKHNHTSACYKQETGPCNAQHKTSTRTTTKTAHCNNCLIQTSQTVYVHWDHCYGNGQDYELGGYHICNTCGSRTFSWGGSTAGTGLAAFSARHGLQTDRHV